MRTTSLLALVSLAFGLLLLGWVFSTQPFQSPDEPAHYLRAVSIANGRLLGSRVGYAPTSAQSAWVEHDARGVRVSPALAPPGYACVNGKLDVSPGGCLEPTYTGDYEPLPYLLPALAIHETGRVGHAVWAARLASALPCLAFFVLAFALLWAGSPWSVLGLLVAITPMTLFIDSVINPNGLEIAAALAFAAGVLRVSRAPASVPRWVWAAVAGSGAAAILAWQLGWVFVAADGLLLVAMLGRKRLTQLARAHRRPLAVTAAVLLGALALYVIYGESAGLLHGRFAVSPLKTGLRLGLVQLHNALYGAVGVFGSLTVGLPTGSYWVWWLLVIAVGGGGLVLAGWPDRVVMLLTTVVAVAFPVLFYAWVYRYSGFGLQARYVLPMLTLIPLVGGELLFRARERLSAPAARWLPGVAVTIIAGFQLFAWWINARLSAGEPGAIWFLGHPRWSPPLGWWPWTASAVIGAALLLALAAGAPIVARRSVGAAASSVASSSSA